MDEFGKVLAQSRLMKALSIFWSVGFCLLLDQVNALSNSGSSIREREFMVSLKLSASFCLKLLLFLSVENLMRLKSPRTIQGVGVVGAIDLNSSRKDCLRACSVGAYTFVIQISLGDRYVRRQIVSV